MANAVRVITIVSIDRGSSTPMRLADHQDIQFVIVVVALMLLDVLMVVLVGRLAGRAVRTF